MPKFAMFSLSVQEIRRAGATSVFPLSVFAFYCTAVAQCRGGIGADANPDSNRCRRAIQRPFGGEWKFLAFIFPSGRLYSRIHLSIYHVEVVQSVSARIVLSRFCLCMVAATVAQGYVATICGEGRTATRQSFAYRSCDNCSAVQRQDARGGGCRTTPLF